MKLFTQPTKVDSSGAILGKETELVQAMLFLVKEALKVSDHKDESEVNAWLFEFNEHLAEILQVLLNDLEDGLKIEKKLINFLKTGSVSQKRALFRTVNFILECQDLPEEIKISLSKVKQWLLLKILFGSKDTALEVRSSEARQMLQRNYEESSQASVSYFFYGDDSSYNYTINGIVINTHFLIESLLSQYRFQPPLRVIDLGAAYAATVTAINENTNFIGRVECHGLDACVRDKDMKFYHQGNVETFSYPLEPSSQFHNPLDPTLKFQLIFTRNLFMHLVDPAGALTQAFDRLEVGGILIVDQFTLRGCKRYLNSIIVFLRDQGVRILADTSRNQIMGLMIQKTRADQVLELPILPACMFLSDDRMSYKPIEDLVRFDNHEPAFRRGKNFVTSKIKELDISFIVEKFDDIRSLIKSSCYKNLPINKKYFAILGVTAKHLNQEEFSMLEERLFVEVLKSSSTYSAACLIKQAGDFAALFNCLQNIKFTSRLQGLNDRQQMELIQYLSYRDILSLGRREADHETLRQMGCYNYEDKKFYWENPHDDREYTLEIEPSPQSSCRFGKR